MPHCNASSPTTPRPRARWPPHARTGVATAPDASRRPVSGAFPIDRPSGVFIPPGGPSSPVPKPALPQRLPDTSHLPSCRCPLRDDDFQAGSLRGTTHRCRRYRGVGPPTMLMLLRPIAPAPSTPVRIAPAPESRSRRAGSPAPSDGLPWGEPQLNGMQCRDPARATESAAAVHDSARAFAHVCDDLRTDDCLSFLESAIRNIDLEAEVMPVHPGRSNGRPKSPALVEGEPMVLDERQQGVRSPIAECANVNGDVARPRRSMLGVAAHARTERDADAATDSVYPQFIDA